MSQGTWRSAESLKRGNIVQGTNGKRKVVREVDTPNAGHPAQPDDITDVTYHDGLVRQYHRTENVNVVDTREST